MVISDQLAIHMLSKSVSDPTAIHVCEGEKVSERDQLRDLCQVEEEADKADENAAQPGSLDWYIALRINLAEDSWQQAILRVRVEDS